MNRRKIGDIRYLRKPGTTRPIPASKIADVIEGGWLSGGWGKYKFQAWLEEDLRNPGYFYISFPYYRNGRFAGQYTFRAPPASVRALLRQMHQRGWLNKRGWTVHLT